MTLLTLATNTCKTELISDVFFTAFSLVCFDDVLTSCSLFVGNYRCSTPVPILCSRTPTSGQLQEEQWRVGSDPESLILLIYSVRRPF